MDRYLLLVVAVIAAVILGSLESRAGGYENGGCAGQTDYRYYNIPRSLCPTPHNKPVGPTRDDARNWAGMAAAMDFAGFPMGKKLAANFNYANVDFDEGAFGGVVGYQFRENWGAFFGGAVGVDNGDGAIKLGIQYSR